MKNMLSASNFELEYWVKITSDSLEELAANIEKALEMYRDAVPK